MNSVGFVFSVLYSQYYVFFVKNTEIKLFYAYSLKSKHSFIDIKQHFLSNHPKDSRTFKLCLQYPAETMIKSQHKWQGRILFHFKGNKHKQEHGGLLRIQLTGLLNWSIFYSNCFYFLLSSIKADWHAHTNEINRRNGCFCH